MPKIFGILLMCGSVVISSLSQILLKTGAKKNYSSAIREYLNFYVISGYGLMFVSMLLPILAYKIGLDYKEAPVIEAIGPALVTILSFFFFKEKLTAKKIIGNILVVIGIIVFYLNF